jgi:acyl-coenzyme A synthetase/AMP-(fatty) acid ligase
MAKSLSLHFQTLRPTSTALWFDNDLQQSRKWTFPQVQKESIKSSIFLRNILQLSPEGESSKIKSSPYILTILSRLPEWWFLHLAAIRIGSIFCPGTTMLTSEDIEYRLDASRARMIITDEENMGKIDDAVKNLKDFGLKKVCKILFGFHFSYSFVLFRLLYDLAMMQNLP